MRSPAASRRRCAPASSARARRRSSTLDGDGQNDPAFIPTLIAALEQGAPGIGLVAGQRVGRKATGFKQLQSRIANAVRGAVLQDGTRDTGCGLKAFRRDVFLALPYFDALHRFLPALVRREGFDVGYVDVVDRPRLHGVSNYGFLDRLWVGILDLAGVWWLIRRKKTRAAISGGYPCSLISRTRSAIICRTSSSAAQLVDAARLRRTVACSPCALSCNGSRPNAPAAASFRWRSGSSRSAAALLLLVYALYRKDAVFIAGQAFGVLRLCSQSLFRDARQERGGGGNLIARRPLSGSIGR